MRVCVCVVLGANTMALLLYLSDTESVLLAGPESAVQYSVVINAVATSWAGLQSAGRAAAPS